jgi:hypothetical protein
LATTLLIKDATAAFSQEGKHAALEVNGPQFAHAILTTKELLGVARKDTSTIQIKDKEELYQVLTRDV